jgi:Rieske Fe-S protein
MNNNDKCKNCTNCSDKPSRRKVLGWIIGTINGIIILAIIGPVLGFIGSPLKVKRRDEWVDVLGENELSVGETKEVLVSLMVRDGYRVAEMKYTVFLKKEQNQILAFNPACTHLGCRISFQKNKSRYFCPCHGGVFDDQGNVVSGPPPRPLDTYPVKIENGRILIQKKV